MAKKFIGAALGLGILGGLCVFVYLLTTNRISIGYNKNYEPTQPIPYSHALHAGKLGIDCKYCHTTTEVGRHASVPPLKTCMNCHIQIRQVGGKDSPHIAKLIEHYESGKAVEWVRVHLLPDFVKFNHGPHIRAGKTCQECHGQIQEMAVVKQYSDMSMGWCVNCHRKPENNASTNCGTCHY
jgi:hypothetical protein